MLGNNSDLEAAMQAVQVDDLLAAFGREATKVYLLVWHGNKIPRGAIVAGETVAMTSGGMVSNKDQKIVGTYDRLVEFGGEGRDLQVMIVYPFVKKEADPERN